MGRLATAYWSMTAESGLTRYLWQIQRFPMLERHDEYMLAKRWREHGDHEAAHKLVNSHLLLLSQKVAREARPDSGKGRDSDISRWGLIWISERQTTVNRDLRGMSRGL